MKDDKTILILTAQFGAGHISAAKAVKECIIEKYSNYNVVIQNFINASIPMMNKPMVKLYENNTKYTRDYIITIITLRNRLIQDMIYLINYIHLNFLSILLI